MCNAGLRRRRRGPISRLVAVSEPEGPTMIATFGGTAAAAGATTVNWRPISASSTIMPATSRKMGWRDALWAPFAVGRNTGSSLPEHRRGVRRRSYRSRQRRDGVRRSPGSSGARWHPTPHQRRGVLQPGPAHWDARSRPMGVIRAGPATSVSEWPVPGSSRLPMDHGARRQRGDYGASRQVVLQRPLRALRRPINGSRTGCRPGCTRRGRPRSCRWLNSGPEPSRNASEWSPTSVPSRMGAEV